MMYITQKTYTLTYAEPLTAYTLHSPSGMVVEILNLGGIITKILVPDQDGHLENVVLAFEDFNDYIENPGHLGALIGRFAGRIHKGHVAIDGISYQLPILPNGHHLHGGVEGFDRKRLSCSSTCTPEYAKLTLSYRSPHLEEGFPGNVDMTLTYTLTPDDTLMLDYYALTDAPTLVNLTNHTYFNLSGNYKTSILDHTLQLNAPQLVCLDDANIPTGKYLDVWDTPFDFTTPKTIGKDINSPHPQLGFRKGYDHPWLLDKSATQATLYHPPSGRQLDILTDQKAMVIYTQNGPIKDFSPHTGICFESQQPPIGYDQVHKTYSLITPSTPYKQHTIWKFSQKKAKSI